jgi:hypothetical protein
MSNIAPAGRHVILKHPDKFWHSRNSYATLRGSHNNLIPPIATNMSPLRGFGALIEFCYHFIFSIVSTSFNIFWALWRSYCM